MIDSCELIHHVWCSIRLNNLIAEHKAKSTKNELILNGTLSKDITVKVNYITIVMTNDCMGTIYCKEITSNVM